MTDRFTSPGFEVGDTFTITGLTVRNPARRWWQFWKPRWVEDTDSLRVFRVIA